MGAITAWTQRIDREYATIRAVSVIRMPGDEPEPLSVQIVSAIAGVSVFVLASLTILTHAAQLLGMPFRTYASIGALMGLIVISAVVVLTRRQVRRSRQRDP